MSGTQNAIGATNDSAWDGVSSDATQIALLKKTALSAGDNYASPNGKNIRTNTTLDSLFSDDFGGSAVDTANNWDVLDGGLGANVDLGAGVLTQAAIGSGTTGMTDGVASSGLTVAMGTTNGAERWYLSKRVFAGKEDILVLLSRSQALAANSIFIGLAEVDPATKVPLLNPNFAGEFANRGGVEIGLTTTSNAYQAEAIGDSSAAKAVGAAGSAGSNLVTTQEFLIEIDSRDIIVSSATIDATTAKAVGASRVSSQCPNDRKLYKLVMRFKNVSAPGSGTSVVIQRVLVVDNYEQRVQVSSAEGDSIGNKSLGVILNAANTSLIVQPSALSTAVVGAQSQHKLISAASTNATSVKVSLARLWGGALYNNTTSVKFVKFYSKSSTPTVGTDVPILTIPLPANAAGGDAALVCIADIVGALGASFALGLAYAITGAAADSDTTAVGAGDVIVNLIYQ